jgi:hypothetical protein
MVTTRIIFRFIIIGIFFLFLFQCNQNPFFDDDWIDLGNRRIHGKVSLSDDSTPDSIFVWLEGFDLGTWTESDGSFELILPLPSEQPGGGLWGGFDLYYYIANYQIYAADIIVQDGYVLDNNGSIGVEGEVTTSPILKKLLDVSTTIEPDTVALDFEGEIECTIMLRAIDDPISVITSLAQDTLLAAFIQNIENRDAQIVNEGACVYSLATIQDIPAVWMMRIPYTANWLKSGNYEIIPFVLILQPYIPPDLLKHFGPDSQYFVLDYLNIPMKRTAETLVVLHPDDDA